MANPSAVLPVFARKRAQRVVPEAASVVTEVPEVLPRSIIRLFWLFARPFAVPVVCMMGASVSLRAFSVLQFYATKQIIDTATWTVKRMLDTGKVSDGLAWAK